MEQLFIVCIKECRYQKCLEKQKCRISSEKKLFHTNKLVSKKMPVTMLRVSEANDLMVITNPVMYQQQMH